MEKNNPLPVQWSSFAKESLIEVYRYIAGKSTTDVAERVTLELADVAESAGKNPYMYAECRELPTKTKSYRNIVRWNYRIIYKISNENILILDIFHCKRNPKQLKKLRRINK